MVMPISDVESLLSARLYTIPADTSLVDTEILLRKQYCISMATSSSVSTTSADTSLVAMGIAAQFISLLTGNVNQRSRCTGY
jgi:hypothetical protein